MLETILIIHIIICVALIGSILMQRSEGGGALGIGGGPGSLMSGRSAANFMTKTTGFLALLFFVTSATLTILSGTGNKSTGSVMKQDANVPASIDLSTKPATNAVANSVGAIPSSQAAPSAFDTSTIDTQKAQEAAKNAVTNQVTATNSVKPTK